MEEFMRQERTSACIQSSGKSTKSDNLIEVFIFIPEFRILRLTFHRKSEVWKKEKITACIQSTLVNLPSRCRIEIYNMDGSFHDHSWIQDFEADFPQKFKLSFEDFWKYYGNKAFAPKEQMLHFS